MLWSQLVCSARGMLKRIDHPSNVMVFKDVTFVFFCFGNTYVHHCLAQLVCPNHQVWKRHEECQRSGLSHLAHKSARSSIQSTYSRRSAKSQEPSFFTKVSRYRSEASIKRRFPPSTVT